MKIGSDKEMSKQSPERLEYLRNYRKNHKEQQRKYQRKYIDKLRQQGKYPISTSMKLRNKIQDLQQELQKKDKIIQVMENYLELIYDLGYDHDGCKTIGDLVCLMDELVRYASLGRACNTTESIYENGNNKYNILHEEIKK